MLHKKDCPSETMNGYEMLFLAQTLITLYSSTYKRITKKTCMRTRLVCHKTLLTLYSPTCKRITLKTCTRTRFVCHKSFNKIFHISFLKYNLCSELLYFRLQFFFCSLTVFFCLMEPLSDSNFRKLLRTKQFPYATNKYYKHCESMCSAL